MIIRLRSMDIVELQFEKPYNMLLAKIIQDLEIMLADMGRNFRKEDIALLMIMELIKLAISSFGILLEAIRMGTFRFIIMGAGSVIIVNIIRMHGKIDKPLIHTHFIDDLHIFT
jgi:hypothetical protein